MSFNSLLGLGNSSEDSALELHAPLMDNAASTTIVDESSNGADGTLSYYAGSTSAITDTGPNSYLTAGLHFDGYAYSGSFPSSIHDAIETANKFTVFIHHNLDVASGTQAYVDFDGGLLEHRSGKYRGWLFSGGGNLNNIGSTAATGWESLASTWDGTTLTLYEAGSSVASTGTARTLSSGSGIVSIAMRQNGWTDPYDGILSGFFIWSRDLSSSEITEIENGPEPENTVTPSLSGTEELGETLTCSTGTWALPSPYSSGSNGTVTYSYQWYRSDDGVADGSAISGETSSTYTVAAADVGKYLHCLVSASNDGGTSSDEDTFSNFTGVISSGGTAIKQTLSRIEYGEVAGMQAVGAGI